MLVDTLQVHQPQRSASPILPTLASSSTVEELEASRGQVRRPKVTSSAVKLGDDLRLHGSARPWGGIDRPGLPELEESGRRRRSSVASWCASATRSSTVVSGPRSEKLRHILHERGPSANLPRAAHRLEAGRYMRTEVQWRSSEWTKFPR